MKNSILPMNISLGGHCAIHNCNPRGGLVPHKLTTQNMGEGGVPLPPVGLKAFPTSLLPLQRGENVIQVKDDIQALKERGGRGGGTAFARTSKSGPQGYLPLLS